MENRPWNPRFTGKSAQGVAHRQHVGDIVTPGQGTPEARIDWLQRYDQDQHREHRIPPASQHRDQDRQRQP